MSFFSISVTGGKGKGKEGTEREGKGTKGREGKGGENVPA